MHEARDGFGGVHLGQNHEDAAAHGEGGGGEERGEQRLDDEGGDLGEGGGGGLALCGDGVVELGDELAGVLWLALHW